MRTRILSIVTATSVALSAVVAPTVIAQDAPVRPADVNNVTNEYIQENFKNPFTLPTAKPQDVVLQVGGSEDSVMLNWITAPNISGQQVRIAEGTAAGTDKVVDAKSETSKVYLTGAYKDDPRYAGVYNEVANHKATVSGLKENTTYTYVVGSDKDGWSEPYTFNTGTYGNEWNFLFFGDPQLYSDKSEFKDQIASWDKTVTTAVGKYPNTSFLLSGGDQANYSAFQEHSGFISPEPLRKHRTAVNNGNHDQVDKPTYDAMYNKPNSDGTNYWYTYNNALIVSLDTNHWKDFDNDAKFVRDVVKQHGADKDWVIVTYHHATFSQAYHMQDPINQYYRERMTPIFSELDVDLVLSGHDHIYTRTYLMDGNKPVDFGREVKRDGETLEKKKGEVQYVTANSSSGSKYYKFYDFKEQKRDETDANTVDFPRSVDEKTIRTYTAVWDQNNVPDYTNVDVTKESLKITTYDMGNGDVIDSFTLKRANEDAPKDDKGSSGSSNKDKDNKDNKDKSTKSDNKPGLVFGLIAAILAAIGGVAFFAVQNGVLPKEITKLLGL